ncbi:hypothetical protein ONZ51_g11474 [Trametes cubensis]|uniref:Uncharacterized protein n=1 Tax=Trametes cubensis TaxID=1111947 RepID=A0AAD7TIM3_9APHY|nr:hypothetical protein ONZ51_g11474 [Trametes cubensis]
MDRRFGMHWEDSDSEEESVEGPQPYDYVGYAAATGAMEQKGYEARAGAPLPFPQLRRIEIARVDFPFDRGLPAQHQQTCQYIPSLDYWMVLGRGNRPDGFDVLGFVKGLRARVERGAVPVGRVDFEESQCLQRERLIPLVEAVKEVWWDGKRLTLDDLGTQEPWSRARCRDAFGRYYSYWSDDEEYM